MEYCTLYGGEYISWNHLSYPLVFRILGIEVHMPWFCPVIDFKLLARNWGLVEITTDCQGLPWGTEGEPDQLCGETEGLQDREQNAVRHQRRHLL